MTDTLHEYPRPRLVRNAWINLNGLWEFQLNTSNEYCKIFEDTINVPFCVESKKSLIQKRVGPEHFMHYRSIITLDFDAHHRVILHFEAVDQTVDIYLNEQPIKHHSGGYTSFEIDVTEVAVCGENALYCCVSDKTEASPLPRGKQRLNNTGSMKHIFYTPCSGLWQTVWVEIVPNQYIIDVSISPDLESQTVDIIAFTHEAGLLDLTISFEGGAIQRHTIQSNIHHTIPIQNLHVWTPDIPNLYTVTLTYNKDTVESYFAMRKISIIEDGQGIKRFALNNTPIFMNGVLDQGYWPESLLTPPNDHALEDDIVSMKEAGFNTIRKHVKIECEPYYALCDRIGMLVWQDMPNGGDDYNFNLVTYLPNGSDFISRHINDHHYTLMKRSDKEGRDQFHHALKAMIHKLKHYPSIVVWVPFNEGWGQFDATQATAIIQDIDASRLINEACGWFDQGGGDIYSIHSYFKPLKVKPKNRVVALTEFGGQALVIKGHTHSAETFGYKMLNKESANDALENLIRKKVIQNIKRGLSASIYTQLSDVENEVNGLMTYDRAVFKFDLERMQSLNQEIYNTFYESQ